MQPAQPVQPAQPAQSYEQQPQQPFAQSYGQQPQQPQGFDGQGAYPPPPPPVSPEYANKPGGKALAALICGIIAILLWFLPVLGIVLGIIAIVLASKSTKESGKNGKATAGKVCGIVGIVISALTVILATFAACAIITISEIDVETDPYDSAIGEALPGASAEEEALSAEEEAAEAAAAVELDKLANQDEGAVQYLAAELDEGFVEGMGVSHTDLGVDPADLARWMLTDFSYTPDGVQVYSSEEGATATMFADIELRDSYAFMLNFYDKASAFNESEEVKTMTEDEAKARLGELYQEAMAETTDMTTWYTAIELVKQDGQWVIDQDSWENELDGMFGIY